MDMCMYLLGRGNCEWSLSNAELAECVLIKWRSVCYFSLQKVLAFLSLIFSPA